MLNPGGSALKLAAVEVSRYEWAAELCRNKLVLDYGCGHGQGSSILNRTAKLVTGYDVHQDAIEHAKATYSENIRFTGSISDEGTWYDVVVCLEVIEHVQDGKELLQDIGRLLRPRGQLLLSTPNKFYTEKHRLNNPFHLHEYYPQEIQTLLRESGFTFMGLSQPFGDSPKLDWLAPITPVFVKKAWRAVHKVRVKPFSEDAAVQLYRCWKA